MNMINNQLLPRIINRLERWPLPDAITRAGIGYLVGRTDRSQRLHGPGYTRDFARAMGGLPIALNADDANAQHYEIPAEFFALILGPKRKYSCCLYPDATTSLANAEDNALIETARHADLADGQTILKLGCGWGSLPLWMAEKFPRARITSVSNSLSQREHILAEAALRGIGNLAVITADMNDFTTSQRYDRVVSVEMFEHMANWRELLGRVRG
jgi:cyclopropane-fatty-acyl-phospholipid synthase